MDEVHAALRTAPLVLAPGAAEAASERVHFLLPQVKLLEEQLREVGNRIKSLLIAMIEANAGRNCHRVMLVWSCQSPASALPSLQLF